MSKSKAIGTKAETALRNYLLSVGYGPLEAHRNVLTGSEDEGDVWVRDPEQGLIVFEVKGGAAAKNASHEQMKKWFNEAEVERDNAGGAYGLWGQREAIACCNRRGGSGAIRWYDGHAAAR